MDRLYFYRCRKCRTVATSPVLHIWNQDPLSCILCHCRMRYLWNVPVTTEEERALFQRGPVWNPGTSKERGV